MASQIVGKFCLVCKNTKPASEFHFRKTSKDGLYTYCKKCTNAQNGQQHKKHREERLKINHAKGQAAKQEIADCVERTGKFPVNRKLLARIFSKIKISTKRFYKGDACWEWQGFVNTKTGYAGFSYVAGIHHVAHRFIYQMIVEAIPDDLQCDHLCRNRICVNPVHIEPVTAQVNSLRGNAMSAFFATQTHCKYGHEFAGDNLRIVYDKRKNGLQRRRQCRTCYSKEYRRSKRLQK